MLQVEITFFVFHTIKHKLTMQPLCIKSDLGADTFLYKKILKNVPLA